MSDDIYNGMTPQNPFPGDPNDPMAQSPIPMPGFHWDPTRNAYVYTDPNGNVQTIGAGGSPNPFAGGSANTPPPATVSGGGGGLTGAASSFLPSTLQDWLRLVATGYGIYGATRGNSFHQAPDPLTDAIRARIFGFIDNSPTRNMLGSALQTYMNNSGGPMPMVPNKYGYDPYNGKPPSYDLSGMIPWLQSTMTQPPSNQQPPNYHINDPTNPVLGMRM